MHKKRIVIAGGGIAGLAAALALEAQAHEVVVCERSADLQTAGAGLQISPNGMKVLRALELETETLARGFQPQALEMRLGRSGRQIFTLPLGTQSQARWGAPYLHLHRADFIDMLSSALGNRAPKALRLGAEVTAYENSDSSIGVTLADGTQLEGDVLLAADGVHSPLRNQMLEPRPPHHLNRPTGLVAWRVVVPVAALATPPPLTACVWVGPRRHGVTYLLRGGTLANFVGVVERNINMEDNVTEPWVRQGTRAEILTDFDSWHPILTQLIEAATQHFEWALYDSAPLPRWHDGRAILIGDAAHPTLPFMAQGAAMALEDALVLARLMASMDDVTTLGQKFYAARISRTDAVQRGARARMKTYHRRHAFTQAATYAPLWLGGKFAPTRVMATQDWLYKYDAA